MDAGRFHFSPKQLSLLELERESCRFDEMVLETVEIDHYCSSTAWCLPAWEAFHPNAKPALYRLIQGYAAFHAEIGFDGREILCPLEACWGLATPIISNRLDVDLYVFRELLAQRNWQQVIFNYMENGIGWHLTLGILQTMGDFYLGPEVTRCVGSLTGGPDAYLGRRTRKFRKSLRRALQDEGRFRWVYYGEPISDWPQHYETILKIEHASWKGLALAGINEEPMKSFYQKMLARIAPAGKARILFAYDGEEPVGYMLGGVLGKVYRGLQFSFDDRFRSMSLGNLLQWKMIEQLCAEGVSNYDLGTHHEYKEKWADQFQKTRLLILRNKQSPDDKKLT